MSDIIQLLPDSVANQIAAGEVVQRPASAVKELLENAVDAGATEITLNIKDAGKTLIQVIDNGHGMSETDARLSLERHATSKIRKAEDLFALTTMGFRGEALPSIAAIAQMEIKSRQNDSDLGVHICVEGSKVTAQEACQTPVGTSILVKNLFFNIPARRNFLKSNPVETKHIIEEFLRVAMIHPEMSMKMYSDGQESYHLRPGTFRQRIVGIYGDRYNQRLVPVKETTDIVSIEGFVGKPEFAKKTRGEQYFFVNGRFIKSPYLNHAIQIAFEELLAKEFYPSYFLRLTVDPAKIDINIHPTKTEIKFEEERAIYAIIRTAVRQALGKYNIAPSLDFEQEHSFDVPYQSKAEVKPPTIKVDPDYNPFEHKKSNNFSSSYSKEQSFKNAEWEKLFDGQKEQSDWRHEEVAKPSEQAALDETWEVKSDEAQERKLLQLHGKYILQHIKSGFIIIDQQRAHERILYEQMLNAEEKVGNQQLLFPEHLEVNEHDFLLLLELMDEVNALGFDISEFGKNTFVIHGVPSAATNENVGSLIDELLEQYKANFSELKLEKRENLVRSLAKRLSIKSGQQLSSLEMKELIDQLFACEMPYSLPNNKPIIITYSLEELDKRFKHH